MSDTQVDEIVENESVEETAAAVETAVSEETTEATSTDTTEEVDETAVAVEHTDAAESEDAEPAEERVLALGDSPEFKWFVAHALTGQENKVSIALKE